MMKSELFTVTSTVPSFMRRGAFFKNVTVHWFVADRKAPVVDLRDWIDFEKAVDLDYSVGAVNELFTADEAAAFREYLLMVHGDDSAKIEPAAGKMPDDIIPWGAIPVGGSSDFYQLGADDDYSLPFDVWGYFDVEQHERIPEPGRKPWATVPPASSNLPWKQGGTAIPPEVLLPGMESHRFTLLEARHNGFESRLQEIEARLTSLERAHEAVHNASWKQGHYLNELEARLANQSRNPA